VSDALRTAVILIPLLIAVAAGLLLAPAGQGGVPTALECVTGEASQNPTETLRDGRVAHMPRREEFDTLVEARNFLCQEVPYPRELHGYEVFTVSVMRIRTLGDGESSPGVIDIQYRNPGGRSGFTLDISMPAPGTYVGPGTPRDFQVMGAIGRLWEEPDRATFCIEWERESYGYSACSGGATRPHDLLPILNSIR
jgi:hypothetical protein